MYLYDTAYRESPYIEKGSALVKATVTQVWVWLSVHLCLVEEQNQEKKLLWFLNLPDVSLIIHLNRSLVFNPNESLIINLNRYERTLKKIYRKCLIYAKSFENYALRFLETFWEASKVYRKPLQTPHSLSAISQPLSRCFHRLNSR
jgi:hypothetical protein